MIKIDKLIDSITSYLKIRFDILKIDLIEKNFFIYFKCYIWFYPIFYSSICSSICKPYSGKHFKFYFDSKFLGYAIITEFVVFFIMYYTAKSGRLKKMIEKELLKEKEKSK